MKKYSTALVLLSAISLSNFVGAHEIDKGLHAAQSGKFGEAQAIWKGEIKTGSVTAMRNYVALYLSGVLSRPDMAQALDLFKRSASTGNSDAQLGLGYIYENGTGTIQDLKIAEKYFLDAAQADNIEGIFMHAKLVLQRGPSGNETRGALLEIRRAADVKYPPAMAMVGDFLRAGSYTDRDIAKAIEYYSLAARAGFLQSYVTLGDIYLFGENGSTDPETAMDWYKQGAAAGQHDAAYAIAYFYYNDPDSSKANLDQALSYAKQAAFAWNEKAQFLLGRIYLEDKVTPRDNFEAYKWFNLAASAGVTDAHYLRAITERALGLKRTKQAQNAAKLWFNNNHRVPHTHPLLKSGKHILK